MFGQFHKVTQAVAIAFFISLIINFSNACAPPPVPTTMPIVAPTRTATPTIVRILTATPVAILTAPATPAAMLTPARVPTAAPAVAVSIAPDVTSRRLPLTLAINRFSPSALTARAGQPIRLNLYNSDSLLHEFAVDDSAVLVVVEPQATQRVDFVINKAGTYVFACNLILEGDHRSLGMTGSILVEP